MGYISPSDPLFARARLAEGEGIHTDEASSALPAIADMLTPSAEHKLEARTTEASLPSAIRENPKLASDEVVMPQTELMELAFLVTGMWGPEKKSSLHEVSVKTRLPVLGARSNPRTTRMEAPFWTRMERLARRLAELEALVGERYARRTASGGGAGRTWTKLLGTLRQAVAYVLSRRGTKRPSIRSSATTLLGLREGAWHPLAGKGNSKLPFVAYSELPMATCPGAGDCAVYPDGKKGWCYSVRAFRYAPAYQRMFLNTLANYADREFAIEFAGGPSDPREYDKRVQAAVDGASADDMRIWPDVVKGLALKLTAKGRAGGKATFMRLFVDGDINYEDCILAWMDVCRDIGPKGRDAVAGHGHIEVYGYSKCWQQFVNVDKAIEGRWPVNYTVNLSSGSIYASPLPGYTAVRKQMEKLPVSRGYFEAVNLKGYLKQLEAQTKLFKADPEAPVPMNPAGEWSWKFDPARVRMLLRLNGVESLSEATQLLPGLKVPVDRDRKSVV